MSYCETLQASGYPSAWSRWAFSISSSLTLSFRSYYDVIQSCKSDRADVKHGPMQGSSPPLCTCFLICSGGCFESEVSEPQHLLPAPCFAVPFLQGLYDVTSCMEKAFSPQTFLMWEEQGSEAKSRHVGQHALGFSNRQPLPWPQPTMPRVLSSWIPRSPEPNCSGDWRDLSTRPSGDCGAGERKSL